MLAAQTVLVGAHATVLRVCIPRRREGHFVAREGTRLELLPAPLAHWLIAGGPVATREGFFKLCLRR